MENENEKMVEVEVDLETIPTEEIYITEETYVCAYCGREYTSAEEHDNGLCDECTAAHSRGDIFFCAGCDEFHSVQDGVEFIDTGEMYCRDCWNHFGFHCEHCDNYFSNSYDSFSDRYSTYCEGCFNAYYVRCYDCECIIAADDAISYDGDLYCECCYRDHNMVEDGINDYSYKPAPHFFKTTEDHGNIRYMGVELEISGGGYCDHHASELREIFGENEMYCKSDCSIDNGFECVTHPMTLAYHERANWDQFAQRAIDLDYRSHETRCCGLHVHVNRSSLGENDITQTKTIGRIIFWMENNWRNVCKIARRESSQWAARYGMDTGDTPSDMTNKTRNETSRYHSLNLNNRHTVEFRIFKGSLKYNTIIATLQFVNAVCELAYQSTDDEIMHSTWEDFVSYVSDQKELITYMKERGIYPEEVAVGTCTCDEFGEE